MSEEMTRKGAIEYLINWDKALESQGDSPFSDARRALSYGIHSLETDEAYQLEYERTTKNDLGVDAVSRKELLKIYEDRFIELQKLKHLKDNKGAEDRQMGVNYCINILKELPSVTPQEPIYCPKFRNQQEKHRVFHTVTAVEKFFSVIGNDDVIDDISVLKELVRKMEVEE